MGRVLILAALVWLGFAGRLILETRLPAEEDAPLRTPFAEYPTGLLGEGWSETDVPLTNQIRERAGVTNYLQRVFVNEGRLNHGAVLYVGYVSGWKEHAIHNPGVCFPGQGFVQKEKNVVEIPIDKIKQRVVFDEYEWLNQSAERAGRYTLSTFYFNGKFSPNDLALRAERILGVRYFAIITLSGPTLGSRDNNRKFYYAQLAKLLPKLLEHFPEETHT